MSNILGRRTEQNTHKQMILSERVLPRNGKEHINNIEREI
jgi:hypothetical protein